MSLKNCIPGLIADGKIRKGDGEKAQRAYDRHLARVSHEMSPEAAAAEASRLTLHELKYEHDLKRRQTFLQLSAQQRMKADMERYKGSPYRAASALLGSDAKAPYASVEAQHRAVLGRIHGRMEGVLAAHSRNLLGEARDKAGLADLVRERFGEDTGNRSAKELAAAFGEAAEYARTRFNRAGGNIGQRPDWGLPQAHDASKVRAVPYEEWRNDITGKGSTGEGIDLSRMIDDSTGQPFTPVGIEEALQSSWQSIRSDGWIRRKPGGAGDGKLGNQRADHRFFVFKNADAWLGYQAKYGTGNAFEAMVGHAEGMARDIALMEVLGPNPKASVKWLQDAVQKRAAIDPEPGGALMDKARSESQRIGDLYDVVSGRLNSPVNERAARTLGGVRSFLTSTLLGSAQLSAFSDVAFQAVTRGYNGLPVMGAITGYLKLFSVLGGAERKRVAVRLGLIAEEAGRRAASLNRYVDGTHGPEVMSRLADAVLRVSGLSPWTQNGRWAFGMELFGHLADERSKDWDALDAPIRSMFERYGIDQAGWNQIRASEPYRYTDKRWGTSEFLRPDDVADEKLGDAMLRMALTETDYAVPAATARARAALSFGQRPGTLGGEIIRNGALFKSFGVSMLLTHGARMMEGTPWSRAKYFAGLTITTGLLGYLGESLYALATGKDLPDPTAPVTWGKAELRGGGFGIFGDFLGSSTNRFGGGFAETLSGPVVGAASDVARAGYKAVGHRDARTGEWVSNPGGAGMDLFRRYVPGESLWYSRLAWNRYVADQLQQWADPNYAQSWARMERAGQQQGQDYWWRPGQGAPDRAPNVGRVPE
jgi:hypothetical protein